MHSMKKHWCKQINRCGNSLCNKTETLSQWYCPQQAQKKNPTLKVPQKIILNKQSIQMVTYACRTEPKKHRLTWFPEALSTTIAMGPKIMSILSLAENITILMLPRKPPILLPFWHKDSLILSAPSWDSDLFSNACFCLGEFSLVSRSTSSTALSCISDAIYTNNQKSFHQSVCVCIYIYICIYITSNPKK